MPCPTASARVVFIPETSRLLLPSPIAARPKLATGGRKARTSRNGRRCANRLACHRVIELVQRKRAAMTRGRSVPQHTIFWQDHVKAAAKPTTGYDLSKST